MKIAISRDDLHRALAHVRGIVEHRQTVPILSNVKIAAKNGQVSLTTTDLDLVAVETATAKVAASGAVTLPAQTLFDITRKLKGKGDVSLERAGGGADIEVRAGRSTFTLPCLPADDFPVSDADRASHRFELAAADLARLIERTRFAMSTEETRYYLNGIFLHVLEAVPEIGRTAPVLCAVATDGHRMATTDMPAPVGTTDMPGVIIPRKTVGEMKGLLDDVDGDTMVAVGVSDARISAKIGTASLQSRLVDGNFPDYERVIPKDGDKTADAAKEGIAQAIDRVSTVTTDKSRAVKMALAPGKVSIEAQGSDAGRGFEDMDVEFQGSPLQVGFNARYMLDILSQIPGEKVRMRLTDAGGAILITDPTDPSARYVLMPMRV